MNNLNGTTLKGYELRERIGAGGFGAIYKAYQSTVGREVAIKMILPGRASQPDFIRRFESGARGRSCLNDCGIANDLPQPSHKLCA